MILAHHVTTSSYVFTPCLGSFLLRPVCTYQYARSTGSTKGIFSLCRIAVPFWGQTSQILSSLSSKRDCSTGRVDEAKPIRFCWVSFFFLVSRVRPTYSMIRWKRSISLCTFTNVTTDQRPADHHQYDWRACTCCCTAAHGTSWHMTCICKLQDEQTTTFHQECL